MFKIKFNLFLLDKRTQKHQPLLSVTFSGLDLARKIEKHVSSFYVKHAAWCIQSSFVTGTGQYSALRLIQCFLDTQKKIKLPDLLKTALTHHEENNLFFDIDLIL